MEVTFEKYKYNLPSYLISHSKYLKINFTKNELTDKTNKFLYRTYLFTNYPVYIVNLIRRVVCSEIKSLAHINENFKNFTNNSKFKNEVLKNQLEFSTTFSIKDNDIQEIEIKDSQGYDCKCLSKPILGSGANHPRWQIADCYYKFKTEIDNNNDNILDKNINSLEKKDSSIFEIEKLNDKRRYIRSTIEHSDIYPNKHNEQPKTIILVVEALHYDFVMFNKNKYSQNIDDILFNAISIIINKIDTLIEQFKKGNSQLKSKSNTECENIKYFLESFVSDIEITIENNTLYINSSKIDSIADNLTEIKKKYFDIFII